MESSSQTTIDVELAKQWLHDFSAATRTNVGEWTVKPWGKSVRFERIPDLPSARSLSEFLRKQYGVASYVYDPIDNGYEVPVLPA